MSGESSVRDLPGAGRPSGVVNNATVAAGALVMFGLYLMSRYSYLLFLSFAEGFSILVACGVFMFAWNSRHLHGNGFFTVIGVAYLFVGFMDLLHILAYEGINVFPGSDPNLAVQLWIAARYVQGLSLLIAPLFLGRRPKGPVLFLGYIAAVALLLGAIFYWGVFPDCFVVGAGLTPFKKGSEYAIGLVLLASIAVLVQKRRALERDILRLLVASIATAVCSELAFTLYASPYGLPNLVGHMLKIVSFYFMYRAVIEIGLARPYDLLLRDLKEGEKELRRSETRTQAILDTVVDGIVTIDERGIVESFNPAAERIFGYAAAEIIGQNVRMLMPEPYRSAHDGYIARYLRTGEARVIGIGREAVGQRKDGSTFPLDLALSEVCIVGGQHLFTGVVRDITVRKQAEAEEETLQKLSAFPRENPNPVLESDAGGNVVYANAAVQRILDRLEIEQMSGLLPPNHTQIVQTCLEKGQRIDGIEAVVHGRVFSWSYHPISTTDVVHLYGADITERKQAEAALRDSEARLRGILEHLPNGVCMLDMAGRIVLMNPVAQNYLQALAGRAAEGEVISRFGEHPVEDVLRPREDGSPHEVSLKGPPGRVFEVAAQPIEEEGYVLVIREVTERRAVEEKVQQQERLAAVGQLAAGIAHDFNNLLTVMMGTAQIIEMRQDVPDTLHEELRNIYTQGQRAAQLVRQVLDFSRQTTAERQAVDLVPFLKETVKMLTRTLPASIRITSDFGDGPYMVEANLTQLQQVITNLSVNARDAMPDGGELRIGLSRMHLAGGKRPPIPNMAPGEWVVWTVSDTGTGMPPEVVAHIYEPFFTTKARGEGTGLGLAQVYGIVRQHKGFIDVESQVGGGTTFTVYLPQVAEAAEGGEQEEEDAPEGAGETILVVEDEEAVQKVVRSMLEGLGYRVITAGDGREGLSAYGAHREAIALVVTDVVMPEMGGLELFEALKEEDPDVPVVMMTGYALGGEGSAGLPDGVAGVLSKPLSMEQMAQVVRAALGK